MKFETKKFLLFFRGKNYLIFNCVIDSEIYVTFVFTHIHIVTNSTHSLQLKNIFTNLEMHRVSGNPT